MDKFDEYFLPKTNTSVERSKFYGRTQEEGESFDTFMTEIRKIAANCNFGTFQEEMLKDRIVVGIRDARVKDTGAKFNVK